MRRPVGDHSAQLRRIAASSAEAGRTEDAEILQRAADRLAEMESGVALDIDALEERLSKQDYSRATSIGDTLLEMHHAALLELGDDAAIEDFVDFLTLVYLSAAASLAVSGGRPDDRVPSLSDFLATARERFLNAVIVDARIAGAEVKADGRLQ
jgi:hypothetical protein